MHAHCEADHVYGFLDVCRPVASFLGVIDLVDDDVVLFLAVGTDVILGEPDFAGIFRSGQEVDDVLFYFDCPLLLFLKVCDAFAIKEMFPVVFGYLDMVLYRR